MRKDLKHWDEAMKLAEQMDPDSIGSISRQYANMLEVRGDYTAALDYYQQVWERCGTRTYMHREAADCCEMVRRLSRCVRMTRRSAQLARQELHGARSTLATSAAAAS